MAAIAHVRRRGAVYIYRRRIPKYLADRCQQSHFVLSTGTKDQRQARRLAAVFNAVVEDFFATAAQDPNASPAEMGEKLRQARGQFFASEGPPPTAIGPGKRHGSRDDDLTVLPAAALLATFGGQALGSFGFARTASWMAVPPVFGAHELPRSGNFPSSSLEHQAARNASKYKDAAETSSDVTILKIGQALMDIRARNQNWDGKTCKQAKQIYGLFARYVSEAHGIKNICQLRQRHIATFVHFLQFEVYKHHGKSAADEQRSIQELRDLAKTKPENTRGVEAPTLNRHLGFLQQLFNFAPSQGFSIDPSVTTKGLRARAIKDRRDRYARPTMTLTQAESLFRTACFTGCADWKRPTKPGREIFHRALYWLPIMLFYGGARREEYCGLLVTDIREERSLFYIELKPNKFRRLKNTQSMRRMPVHSELIRLGFLDYVEAVKKLGYDLLFPDLYSPTSRSPLGDRFYDEFKRVLVTADVEECGVTIHSLRRAFGNELKQRRVTVEERADLLGHAGQTETDERYCDTFDLRRAKETIEKMPVVTAHLVRTPIRLLPWIVGKKYTLRQT